MGWGSYATCGISCPRQTQGSERKTSYDNNSSCSNNDRTFLKRQRVQPGYSRALVWCSWSLGLFILKPAQLPGEHTARLPFRRTEAKPTCCVPVNFQSPTGWEKRKGKTKGVVRAIDCLIRFPFHCFDKCTFSYMDSFSVYMINMAIEGDISAQDSAKDSSSTTKVHLLCFFFFL